jgi:hypothetical protein
LRARFQVRVRLDPKKQLVDKPFMRSKLRSKLTKKLQNIFWVYWTNNFVISRLADFKLADASNYEFIPITPANCFRVRDFRSEDHVSEYRDKVAGNEIGFFAEGGGKTVGSIWATVNREPKPAVARGHIKLRPNEALIHDIVTGEHCRGRGVGPFMVGRIASTLLSDYRVSRIVIDVNVKNSPSLRMMQKAGLRTEQQVLCISAFGRPVVEKVIKQYA